MTLARLIATGSGRLAARVAIPGLDIEAVSDPGMEREAYRTARAHDRVAAVTGFATGFVREPSASAAAFQGGTDFSGLWCFTVDQLSEVCVPLEKAEVTGGWLVYTTSAGAIAHRIIDSGGGTNNCDAPNGTLAAGVRYVFGWSWDGTNHRIVVVGDDGSDYSKTETPALTYAAPGSTQLGLGAYSFGAAPYVDGKILGFAWADATSQTTSELRAAAHAALKRGYPIADDLTGTTNLVVAHDLATDLVGSASLEQVSTPTNVYVDLGDDLTGAFPGNAHTIEDQVGSGTTCTATPWPTSIGWDDGPPNQSVRGGRVFDGTNDAWGEGDATQLAACQGDCTLTLWASIASAPAAEFNLFTFGADTTVGDADPANNTALTVKVLSSGYLEVFWEYSTGTNETFTQSAGTAFSFDGEYHRIDVVKSSTGTAVAFYIDGALVDSTTGLNQATGGGSPPKMVIGGGYSGLGTRSLDGSLWGIMLRDVALTAEAIAAEYADGPAEAPNADVIGLWCVGDNEPARVHCFDLFGEGASTISLDESVNIPEGALESNGLTLKLYETRDEEVSQALAKRPTLTRYLTTSAEASDTTLYLLSTTGIAAGDILHAGTECIIVGGVSGDTLTYCERGARGTVARKLWTDDDVTGRTAALPLTDAPERVRGRRMNLYLYGDADDLQGDGGNSGSPVWRSVVTMEPRLTEAGMQWGLTGGGIASLLDTKIGGELDVPFEPRGIYYSWAAPLRFEVTEYISGVPTFSGGFFTGHYESQDAFLVALNTWLDTFISSGSYSSGFDLRAEARGAGEWGFALTWGVSTTSVFLNIYSLIDGKTARVEEEFLDSDGVALGPEANPSSGDNLIVPWWANPDGIEGARTVPRGSYGTPSVRIPGVAELLESDADAATYPEDRVYPGRAVDTDWSSVTVEWVTGGERVHFVPASGGVDAAAGWVSLGRPARTGVGDTWEGDVYTSKRRITMRATRSLAGGSLGATVEDLRQALISESTENSMRGLIGSLTSDDLADWSEVATDVYRFYWQRRNWTLAGSADVQEMLQAEFRLIGVFPITDSAGKIALQKIGIPNASQGSFTAIDEEIISVGWSTMERGNQTVNRWRLSTGYQPVEDEWNGPTMEVWNTTSLALDNMDRALLVEPRSVGRGEDGITTEQLAQAALPVVSMYGFPYDIVTVNVSWKLFNTRLGDFVSFSAAEHLPSRSTGLRPMGAVSGVVIGRKWEIGKAHGTLTLYISSLNVAGYSPSARVAGYSNVSGNQWNVTVAATTYTPLDSTGASVADAETYFAATDEVRLSEMDGEVGSVARYYEGPFSASNYHQESGSTSTLQGGANFSAAIMLRCDAVPTSADILAEKLVSLTGGWAIYTHASGYLRSRIDGSGVSNYSDLTTALEVGRTYIFAFSWDGTNHRVMMLGDDGTYETTNDTPGITYAAPGSTVGALGAASGGSQPCDGLRILGFAWADATSKTEAELTAICEAAIDAGQIQNFTGVTNAWFAPDLETDVVGSVDFVEQGTVPTGKLTVRGASPLSFTGSVNSISTNLLVIDFDSALWPYGVEWDVIYQDTAVATSAQELYCGIADSTARLDSGEPRTYGA